MLVGAERNNKKLSKTLKKNVTLGSPKASKGFPLPEICSKQIGVMERVGSQLVSSLILCGLLEVRSVRAGAVETQSFFREFAVAFLVPNPLQNVLKS